MRPIPTWTIMDSETHKTRSKPWKSQIQVMSTPKPSWAAPGFENAKPQHEPILLSVKGKIPSWLSGSLYRTGPGTFHIHPTSSKAQNDANPKPKVSVSHWFDGLGMNHQFKITPQGEVYYSNRSSSDGRIDHIQQTGRTPSNTFGKQQDPCEELFKKFFTTFVPHDSNNPHKPSGPGRDMENISVTLTPNIPGLSSHTKSSSTTGLHYLVAGTDSNWLQILDPETLKPLEITTYARLDKRLTGHLSAAHSCSDPSTGEHFNYVQKFSSVSSCYKIFRATPSVKRGEKARVDILAEITDAPMAYIHSFAITKGYVVLCVWQSDYGENGLAVFKNKDVLSSIQKWNPNRDTLFYVISREHGGVVAKYKAPTFFSFHTINAYETPSKSDPHKVDITIDISTYETNAILNMLYLDHMRIADPTKPIESPHARRYILPNIKSSSPATFSSSSSTKSDIPINPAKLVFKFSNIELPTIHPKFHSSPYRYAYGTHKAEEHTHASEVFTDKIVKIDMESRTQITWGAEGYTTGEPIFVPRPHNAGGTSREDDGVILSIVLDGVEQRSVLVVLDARDLREIARAEMDRCVPLGFHGYFAGNLGGAASSKL